MSPCQCERNDLYGRSAWWNVIFIGLHQIWPLGHGHNPSDVCFTTGTLCINGTCTTKHGLAMWYNHFWKAMSPPTSGYSAKGLLWVRKVYKKRLPAPQTRSFYRNAEPETRLCRNGRDCSSNLYATLPFTCLSSFTLKSFQTPMKMKQGTKTTVAAIVKYHCAWP